MDGGDVLRFRPRELFDDPGRYDTTGSYDRFSYPSAGVGSLGDLTQVVLVGDQVLTVRRRPVHGSEFEDAVLDLEERGLYRRPAPPPPPPAPPEPPRHEQHLAWLARIVGGEAALHSLDLDPLVATGLDLESVPEHLRGRVEGIAQRVEQWAAPLLGEEGLAAARLLLTRAVAAEPGLLRSERDDIAAGAVLYAVAKGNDLVGTGRPLRVSVFQAVCALRSSPADRGHSFAYAAGGGPAARPGWSSWSVHHEPDVVPLGSPDLLLSRFRRRVADERDIALALRAHTPEEEP